MYTRMKAMFLHCRLVDLHHGSAIHVWPRWAAHFDGSDSSHDWSSSATTHSASAATTTTTTPATHAQDARIYVWRKTTRQRYILICQLLWILWSSPLKNVYRLSILYKQKTKTKFCVIDNSFCRNKCLPDPNWNNIIRAVPVWKTQVDRKGYIFFDTLLKHFN